MSSSSFLLWMLAEVSAPPLLISILLIGLYVWIHHIKQVCYITYIKPSLCISPPCSEIRCIVFLVKCVPLFGVKVELFPWGGTPNSLHPSITPPRVAEWLFGGFGRWSWASLFGVYLLAETVFCSAPPGSWMPEDRTTQGRVEVVQWWVLSNDWNLNPLTWKFQIARFTEKVSF